MAEKGVESETASLVDEQVSGGGASASAGADTRGKHRILAELKRVEQEMKFLESLTCCNVSEWTKSHSQSSGIYQVGMEELEELENTDNVSVVCEELLRGVENLPDPLISLTYGPANPLWDRWFERPKKSQGCMCRIL
ncbi:GUANINE NUCLEOTIDE-BINDING PROTEIN SUBUNIT GAMMA 2 [Salix koriyanagi]|uniref:GUANINE NUCLEOTIDE-BINDING PROTEIN SUBUNIT GAMMA 2 n=1 Tax=Salix koriyanagi TaxID=2511006 RepID=A0A9Q0P4W7_9ROSI|nr:GUANINE NUCLEOTIDE-BINDING PROTEIN SUBUNIT GAMMA 2 [Salix koriyanagi]